MVRASKRERRVQEDEERAAGQGEEDGAGEEEEHREEGQDGGRHGEKRDPKEALGKENGSVATTGSAGNIFAGLDEGDDDQDDQDDEHGAADSQPETKDGSVSVATIGSVSKKKKKKKKAKKSVDDGAQSGLDTAAPLAKPPARETRTDKKLDKEVSKDLNQMSMEDFDAILQDSQKSNAPLSMTSQAQPTVSQPSSSAIKLRTLLSVDPKSLDADAEVRKMFGSRVVESATSELSQQQARARRVRGLPGVNARDNPLAKLQGRSVLARPKATWPRELNVGLEMEKVQTGEEAAALFHSDTAKGETASKPNKPWIGEMWWTYKITRSYALIQNQFLQCVGSGDPGTLQSLLQVYPYHVDTLLQVSEIWKQQGDQGLASDLLDRALFAMERCMSPSFNLTSGSNRLAFFQPASRSFYLALARNISSLTRRGCWKTAFAVTRLLLSLDPYGDPHGAQLWLEFLSPKIGVEGCRWLKSWFDGWSSDLAMDGEGGIDPKVLPGMRYARALSEMTLELASKQKDHSNAKRLLIEAIDSFPQMLPPLTLSANLTMPKDAAKKIDSLVLYGYEKTDPHLSVINFLCALYAERSGGLWKEPEVARWLMQTVAEYSWTKLSTAPRGDSTFDAMPISFARHLVVSDLPKLNVWLPKEFSASPILSFDPLAPADSAPAIPEEFLGNTRSRSGNAGEPELWDQSTEGFIAALRRMLGGLNLGDHAEAAAEQPREGEMDLADQQAVLEQLNEVLDAGEAEAAEAAVAEGHNPGREQAQARPSALQGLVEALTRSWRARQENADQAVD